MSRVINDYCEDAEINTECKSSEEMRASFEEYNKKEAETRKNSKIISMDVKALYPSMDWGEIIISVREMVEESKREIEDVNWHELGKYLAVTMSKEEIEKEGLIHVIPTRKEETGRRITVAYLCNKQNSEKWNSARSPGCRQRKKMLALAISQGIRVCLENHTYKVGDRVFLQKEGGPIGLELTGALSRSFMKRWDQIYLKKVKDAGMKMLMYERYVDDSNQVAVVPPKGTRYDQERGTLVVKSSHEAADGERGDEERLAVILKDIADSVLPCIKMEADWPDRNTDKKLPILDMKVWTNEEGEVMYCHYEKPMASKTVVHSQSAHPQHCKKSVHVQEIIRRAMNCTRKLDWKENTAPFINDYMKRMRIAGYGEKYRGNIVRKAINIYKKKVEDHEKGVRPLFRPKFWKKEERKKEKERKKKEWGTKRGHIAPIFVPTTPDGELVKTLQQVADKHAEEGIHFNIVEVGGRTLKSDLQKSNPTETPGCSKTDCIACKEGRGKGGRCHKNNINYEIECQLCSGRDKALYVGETSRNLYTRAGEHQKCRTREEGEEESDEGFMSKHMRECHNGEERNFKAKVTHSNKDSLTRQVREGVIIRRSNRNLLNTKSEWFQPPLYQVQSEIIRE